MVIGGGSHGGILVREGKDVASCLVPGRLSTLSLVYSVEVSGDRLHYNLLRGSGPSSGWISTHFRGVPLVAGMWKVGGGPQGIVVRTEMDISSPAVGRLSRESWIQELRFDRDRCQYQLVTGSGPNTGWVSRRANGKDLLIPLTSSDFKENDVESNGPVMFNEELGFSYEHYPRWVPHAAAVARLLREGEPYLPPTEKPLERLRLAKAPGSFKKIPPKKLNEMLAKSLPGDIYGLHVPRTAAQLEDLGAEWFTKAFHATGVLALDNRVSRVSVQELEMTGYKKDGGAGMKSFITVDYAKPDPSLHTELFAKYTWDPARNIVGVSTLGQDDTLEVLVAIHCHHLFPFRTPQFYYADISRENSAYMIIMERILYSRRGAQEIRPFEILPGLGKCQDHLLPDPLDFYYALFRAMGQLCAWDKLGRFDDILGPQQVYNETQYLAFTNRGPKPLRAKEGSQKVVGETLDRIIDFILNWAVNVAPPDIRDSAKLAGVKEELVEMAPYFNDMSTFFQMSNSDYVAANHANLQADNAWFWRDEYGDLACGVLDWGGFSRGPFAVRFIGCVSGADADMLIEHMEGICSVFVDEYARCGGPQVSVKDVLRRFHLGFITALYDLFRFVRDHVYQETSQEEFSAFSGPLDDDFQDRFYTRSASLPLINAFTFYIRKGNLKELFDEWKEGDGRPFLTVYE